MVTYLLHCSRRKRDARTTVFDSTLTFYEIGPAILEDFPSIVREQGKYAVAPEPLAMVTKGMEGIHEGFDTLRLECQRRGSPLRANDSTC